MFVPVRAEGQAVGLLSVQSYTPHAFTEQDLRMLHALADYGASALKRLRAEHSLKAREDLTRSILASAMDGFYAADFSADPGGAIIDVNEAYCRMTGYSRPEFLRLRIGRPRGHRAPRGYHTALSETRDR